jgi:hypothetical protein
MSSIEPVAEAKPASESTLGELLERTAYAQLPSRFYATLQLCLPLAYQCWTWGWHRTAGWLTVLSAFGLWALARQKTHGHADDVGEVAVVPSPKSQRLWRVVRGFAATGGSIATLMLVLEAFAQILARVFQCPGCAG